MKPFHTVAVGVAVAALAYERYCSRKPFPPH
jgi:hypothetical protein